ncbi:MAG: metallophosphoesterase [Planctomycetaceae bacterium]|jgi:alkaline phosphatase|nr:metallophosphoesterase [Planctomycetaceae bacterium]
MLYNKSSNQLSRRAFLCRGTLVFGGAIVSPFCLGAEVVEVKKSVLRIGLLTDIHYADKERAGNRYYRESPNKVVAAANELNKQRLNFLVELGDLIDSVKAPEKDKKHLRIINTELKKISNKRYYVLGNHCVETLTKDEFLDEIGQEKSYFSFDQNGYHFVILDACFRQDGTPYGRNNAQWTDTKLPDAELDWLKSDLAATKLPTIAFLHQRLDVENQKPIAVKNADSVRKLLEESGKVKLVLQGHEHGGDYKEIAGISYCTLSAVIEGSSLKNNSFSFLEIFENGNWQIHGFLKQKNIPFSLNSQIFS